MTSPDKARLGNCFLNNMNKSGILFLITKWIREKNKNHHLTAINMAKLVAMQSDKKLAAYVAKSSINFADGSSIYLASKIIGNPLKERVTGVELMEDLLVLANENSWRIYFFGSSPKVLDVVLEKCSNELPNLVIAGSRNGYFEKREEDIIISEIAATNPDIVFVALGIPQKEYFVDDHKDKLNASVVLPVGGAFDVFSGVKSRAPAWVQKYGIEWLWRSFYDRSRAALVISSFFPFIRIVLKEFFNQRLTQARQ